MKEYDLINTKFVILSDLPDLNTYIKAERSNKFAGASLKKKATNSVYLEIKASKCKDRFDKVFLKIGYFCKDRRIDKDNIAFKKKFIFDGMQKAGIIKNDGWNTIIGWDEKFELDKNNPRIEVELHSFP